MLRSLISDPSLACLLPDLPASGDPISITFAADLRVIRGVLHPDHISGREVHAAAYLRRRAIVLDEALRSNAPELRRILLHELFHFVWVRLGNLRRGEYAALLASERIRRARGELGWSAERAKPDAAEGRAWREYMCESFCDTAAWYFTGDHLEATLAGRFRERRRKWLERAVLRAPLLL